MTKEQIKLAIETNELLLEKKDLFKHFIKAIFAITAPIIMLLSYFILEEDQINMTFNFLLIGISVSIGYAAYAYWIKKRNLQFKEVSTNLTRAEILAIIRSVAEKQFWFITDQKTQYIIVKTRPEKDFGVTTHPGEMITIIISENKVLVNCIYRPRYPREEMFFELIGSRFNHELQTNALIKEIKAQSKKTVNFSTPRIAIVERY